MDAAYEAGKRQQFILQLKQDLYYAQQIAIGYQLPTKVVFLNGSKEYSLHQGGKTILRRPFLQGNTVFIKGTLSLSDILFLPNGNAQKSGSLSIKINDHHYRLVMLLGRGRFYIEQV